MNEWTANRELKARGRMNVEVRSESAQDVRMFRLNAMYVQCISKAPGATTPLTINNSPLPSLPSAPL